MDVRNWPLERIMQLPDWCFGRRFLVCVSAVSTGTVPGWDISEVALPEKCVIWEMVYWPGYVENVIDTFRLALGDQLPTTAAMMNALQPLFSGLGVQGAEPRLIPGGRSTTSVISRLRLPVAAAGRRVVLEVLSNALNKARIQLVLVVSSIPTEVPDWLISGPGRSL